MKNVRNYIPLLICIFLFLIIRLLYWCSDSTSCPLYTLTWDITFSVLEPLYIYLMFAVIPALVVIFVKKEVLNSWLYFTAGWLVLSLVLIAIAPTWPSGGNMLAAAYETTKESAAHSLSIAFTVISLILIAWKSFQARSKN